MSVNVLIMAAGPASFDSEDGGYPLCLTEIGGTPLLERIVETTRDIVDVKYTYALSEEDVERFHLDQVVNLLTPLANVVKVPNGARGSACSALLAASEFADDDELLIVSANEFVDVKLDAVLSQFRERNYDAGTIMFKSIHPRYSYVKLDDAGMIIEAAQQRPISQMATVGVFWFAESLNFIEGAKNIIRKNSNTNGKFYIAPVFNELILRHKSLGGYKIEKEMYHPLKTIRQLHNVDQEVIE